MSRATEPHLLSTHGYSYASDAKSLCSAAAVGLTIGGIALR